MIALVLLITAALGQERCASLITKHKCPYGGEWVTWLQSWSGFNDNGNGYDPLKSDEFYYYDKQWPNKMEQGLDLTVTPPECQLNDPAVPVCNPTDKDFCSRTVSPAPVCPYTKYNIKENKIKDDSDGKTRLFRPGGFKYGVMAIYNQPPVCVCVDNSYDRRVEVAVETLTPRARVCIRDATKADTNSNENPGEVSDCDQGRFYKCFTVQSNQDLIFRIYCDQGCEDDNVQLWYRVRMSPYRWTIPKDAVGRNATSYLTEMWCDDIPGEVPTREGAGRMQYPLDVADVVPDNYKYPKDQGAASHVGISSILVAVSAFVTAALCL